jgi:hypothetical protein
LNGHISAAAFVLLAGTAKTGVIAADLWPACAGTAVSDGRLVSAAHRLELELALMKRSNKDVDKAGDFLRANAAQ